MKHFGKWIVSRAAQRRDAEIRKEIATKHRGHGIELRSLIQDVRDGAADWTDFQALLYKFYPTMQSTKL